MFQTCIVVITAALAFIPAHVRGDENIKSLMTRIVEWQYPSAKMSGASMSDGATVNSKGDRTVQSIYCKTVFTTTDSVEKVLEYYKSKLTPKPGQNQDNKATGALPRTQGRSVMFHSDSDGRPVVIHVISVNDYRSSTTLVISRVKGETKTHIAWSQYEKFEL